MINMCIIFLLSGRGNQAALMIKYIQLLIASRAIQGITKVEKDGGNCAAERKRNAIYKMTRSVLG